MNHLHKHDPKDTQHCCSETNKHHTANATHSYSHDEHDHNHNHSNFDGNLTKLFLTSIISFILLLIGISFDYWFTPSWFEGWIRVVWYITAYIPVGVPVIKEAVENIFKNDFFSEFLLMVIATVGAFAIGEYPEAVAVMLFYAVGEIFQTLAVSRAKSNIKSLLDQRPDEVTIIENNTPQLLKAKAVQIGTIIQLKPGEKVSLDGILISEIGTFNTAALTGESVPVTKYNGEAILAGMINLHTVSMIKVTAAYTDSKLSKILELVQEATSQKAPTELFIRKFAKIYTPIVVLLAVGICALPSFWVDHYVFKDWLYRALVFLVISCPCALVISIPLGYFGGIGAASKNGILIKGSNFLDTLASIKNVVMDKTGTMTEGRFQVQEVHFNPEYDKNEILKIVAHIERNSTHPVASAIQDYVGESGTQIELDNSEEIAGHGLKSTINGKDILVGNIKLMNKFGVTYDIQPNNILHTTIAIAYDYKFVGYITIADTIKKDAQLAIDKLKAINVKPIMLSGDKTSVVNHVAQTLGITTAYGDLLPEDKVQKVKEIKAQGEQVAFVGDGVNDAPVVALSDVGIAMGGLGSDATIESADVVIQDDKPSKIPMAITIGKQTKTIVWQNIGLAFGVKAIVLILGAGGIATMWEAVFADVGVALLAILNAIRIQRMQF